MSNLYGGAPRKKVEIWGKFIDEEWTSRGVPTRQQQENILQNGAGRDHPNFVSWFCKKSMMDETMSDDLKQIARGCHTRVLLYNIYDVNGYRFRTHKYEQERPNATTINSGLVTIGQGENDEMTEYYGYIKEIIEISFDGTKPLTLVLFNCHWFDPSQVRYSPRYGLVEVAHASILPKFEPFVIAHQATQVYYMPYPCKSVQDLTNWWVVYKVQPIGRLEVPTDQDYDFVPNTDVVHYFQEDGLLGSFVIDLGLNFDNNSEEAASSRDTEDICNGKDLELLNGSSIQDVNYDDDESYYADSSNEDDEYPTNRDILYDEYF
nr:uncharacterized protein LOC107278789 isoform X1 [Oryza sativa Japonica Group]